MTTITGNGGPNILAGDIEWNAELGEWVYAQTADEIFGLGGDDEIDGYTQGDILWGDEGNDILRGGDGNDTLHGGTGNDVLQGDGAWAGDTGTDLLNGDDGNDYLNGGDGFDYLFGGEDDDELFGNAPYPEGEDGNFLDGGPGNDRLVGTSGANMIFGGDGIDTASLYFLNATDPVEYVAHLPGATPLVGGLPFGHVTGIEIFAQLWGGKGDDRLGAAYVLPAGVQYTLSGQDGEDSAVLDFSAEAGRMRGSFGGGIGYLQNADSGGVLNIMAEHLDYTGNALDGIYAGDAADRLVGLGGNDIFGGGGGNDAIDGAGGDDTLYGGEGDDTITGGAGADWIDGQTGTDTAVFAGKFAEYVVSAQADRTRVTGPGDEVDQLFGIERLRFADGYVQMDGFQAHSTTFTLTAGTTIKAEGNGTPAQFSFTVTRAGAIDIPQAIAWSAAGTTGSGTVPASASDFAGGVLPAGTVSFAPGQASATITVTTAADSAIEANERFAVTLGAAPLSSVVLPIVAQGVIANDDCRFDIAATSAKKAEGSGAGSTGFTFTVTRTGDIATAQTVKYAVTGTSGTATMPADAADFTDGVLPAGTLSFAANQASQVLTIPVARDSLGELNERFAVTLSAPGPGATLGIASAQGLILNDDVSVGFGGSNVSKPEGNAGTTIYSFTVQRAGTLTGTTTVDWSYAPGGVTGTVGTNAADFADGAVPTGGTLTFAPNQTSGTITVAIAGDTNPENALNESFTLTLSNPSGAVLSRTTATGTVRDDDTIYGTSGNDTLSGTAGADLFVIGRGQDIISGGGGVDQFRFIQAAIGPEATRRFTINDFDPAAGEKLDLSRIDAIAGTLANDAFTFIGPMPFSGIAGQLRWDQLSPHLVRFQGDVNADSVPDLSAYVFTPVPASNTWLVL